MLLKWNQGIYLTIYWFGYLYSALFIENLQTYIESIYKTDFIINYIELPYLIEHWKNQKDIRAIIKNRKQYI